MKLGVIAIAVLTLSATNAVAGQAGATAAAAGVYAHFTTTEGNFTVRLFEAEAPKTVANFIGLAQGTKEWTDPKTRTKTKEAVL